MKTYINFYDLYIYELIWVAILYHIDDLDDDLPICFHENCDWFPGSRGRRRSDAPRPMRPRWPRRGGAGAVSESCKKPWENHGKTNRKSIGKWGFKQENLKFHGMYS